MAGNVDGLRVRRLLGRDQWGPPARFGPDGWQLVHASGKGSVIVSVAPQQDGNEWIHASMAFPARVPTYDELKALHAAVFGNGWAYQVFAPPSDHVSIHDYALHLWGRLDGKPGLPDFTHGSGSI